MDLLKQIKEERDKTLEVLEDAHRLRRAENDRIQENKAWEETKFQEFKEIIKGQKYFRQSHIDKLGIKYNICIHLSAKGSGKTTELFRMMTRLVKKGEKFLYGRVYLTELNNELTEFNMDDRCPVYVINYKNIPYFFPKGPVQQWAYDNEDPDSPVPPTPTFKKLVAAGIEPCGRGYTFFGSNSLSGGQYEGYSTIFFDEILSYSPINRISDSVLHAWSASIHTIQRNKPDIRVYMMGNMQNVPEHPILAFYGIDISDNLRIIQRGEHGETTILFINSGGEYGNTIGHKAGSAHHAGIEEQIFLKHNRVIKPSTTVLSPGIFDNLDHSFVFVLSGDESPLFVEYREKELEDGQVIGAIKCGELEVSTWFPSEIWTFELPIYNRFNNTQRRESLDGMFNRVYRLYKHRELYFDSCNSLYLFTDLAERWSELAYENQSLPLHLQI